MTDKDAPEKNQVLYIETLARQLVRRFGKTHSFEICRNNKWEKVREHIEKTQSPQNRR